MRTKWMLSIVAVLVLTTLPAWSVDFGVGLGYTMGNADPDIGLDADTTGFSLIGRGGFQDNWSITGTMHILEDDEDAVEFDLAQLNVGVAYNFIPDGTFRPFVQAGLSYADLSNGTSDDATGLMLGAGAQIGKKNIAFYGAVDYTQVELFDVDFDIVNWTAGAIWNF